MAHYKNVVRDHDDFDFTIDGQPGVGPVRVFILDEREKFDDEARVIHGPRIVTLAATGQVEDCKIRDKDFWAKIEGLFSKPKTRRKKAEKQVGTTPTPEQRKTLEPTTTPGLDQPTEAELDEMGRLASGLPPKDEEPNNGKW